ncbi:MAG: patatin family protein [Coriobacteriales bacterium]|nr:patatin family protein [Coriobacteriales bacterium]
MEQNCNIKDVALIFEGGGMRASYTAAVVSVLLENGLYFKDVYGVSAGASHTVNYISQDAERARKSFVDFLKDKRVAGIGPLMLAQGYFNARYIYEECGLPNGTIPFDFQKFMANPAQMHIESFNRSACGKVGATAYWTKLDTPTLPDLMRRVRASSSLPLVMPPVRIGNDFYVDGGLGDSWGICLSEARRDGYERFFIVRTQMRGYRKQPDSRPWLTNLLFGRHKNLAKRQLERWQHYNALCDEVERLERTGRAYVFYPEKMPINSMTIDINRLAASYNAGLAQAKSELALWRGFLGV